jgi:hypothetical protein
MSAAELARLRGLVLASLPLWLVSFALLFWASTLEHVLVPGQITWQGVLDVVMAFLVCLLGLYVVVKAQARIDAVTQRRSYGIATVVAPLVLAGLWLYPGRLHLEILLPGLAWRTYMGLTVLPAALALWRPGAG